MLNRIKVTWGPLYRNQDKCYGSLSISISSFKGISGKTNKLNLYIQRICNVSGYIYIIKNNKGMSLLETVGIN